MPVTISGDGGITGLQLESFEDVDVGSGASDGDVLTYDATGDLWIPQGIELAAGIGSNVVQAVKTDTFSTTSTSFTTVTGLSATITPSSATSKILVIAQISLSQDNITGYVRIAGGNASVYIGDADSTNVRAATQVGRTIFATWDTREAVMPHTVVYLDSPSTVAPTTYEVEARVSGSSTLLVNRPSNATSGTAYGRVPSSITVIEVAA